MGSFEPFFKEWFQGHYFAKISRKLQQELKDRAKSQGFFAGLGSQFRALVLGSTEGLHAKAWYEFYAKWALPAKFKDYVICRVATINLGSRRRPCYVDFLG